MSRQSTDTCASCAKFSLTVAASNGGVTQCEGFERPTEWDSRACVLWVRASDHRNRADLVKRLRDQQQKEKADGSTD